MGADCKSVGLVLRWFESISTHHAGMAQLAEQLICNQQVVGSSPTTSSTKSPRFWAFFYVLMNITKFDNLRQRLSFFLFVAVL